MIYAVSDLHGEYGLFMKLIDKIGFSKKDTMYIIGDVIDRGPEPLKTLEYIKEKDNIHLLMGNHEMMALRFYLMDQNYQDYQLWMENGGMVTKEDFDTLGEEGIKEVIEYLRHLKLMDTVKVNDITHRLVHAGLYYDDYGQVSKDQDIDFMLWDREKFVSHTYIKDDMVIFGHTPHESIHHYPTRKICIDCGASFTGKLGCLRLDDLEEIYVRKTEE